MDFKDQLIDLYFNLKKELGRAPMRFEFEIYIKKYNIGYWEIRKRYKNWTNFVTNHCKDEPYKLGYYEKGTTCKVKDCNVDVSSRGYCKRHYEQKKNLGYIRNGFETDPKEIITKGKYLEILLYSAETDRIEKILVDSKYLEKIKNISITYRQSKGASVSIENQEIYLTKYLFGELKDDKLMYSFKNKDTRDLREENIRIIDFTENARVRSLPSNNTSGYKGISWNKKGDTYMVRIGHKGKDIYLGSTKSLEEAIDMRQQGEIKYWGKIYGTFN